MRIEENKENLKTKFLPFLVSIIPPSVFLLYLYQRNATDLFILHTLIAIAVFTIVAVILQLIVSWLVKSSCAAALICNLSWILFFRVRSIFYIVFGVSNKKNLLIYSCMLILLTSIIIILLIWYKRKLERKEIFHIISVFWIVLFMLNAVPSFIYAIKSHSTFIPKEKNFKTEFKINDNLQSPNIYWLLMDGMLGFKAMEYFFNDTQSEFTNQLTERGFIINKDAQYEGLHSTFYGAPALMCPTYYDTMLIPGLRSIDITKYNQKIKLQTNAGFSRSASLVRARNELMSAFEKKGYKTSVIGFDIRVYYTVPDYLYIERSQLLFKGETRNVTIDNPEKIVNLVNLTNCVDLIFRTTPLSKIAFIFNFINIGPLSIITTSFKSINNSESLLGETYQDKGKWHLNALADTMNFSESKLVIIHDMRPHGPFIFNKYGNKEKRNKNELYDPNNYPSQHYFASSVVISYIDFILNADPEAIIIIQSDHGLHYEQTRQQFIVKYGKTDEEVRLMQNQTISAVRIPEKYGGLDKPIEPPNITRLLVNRYVGENYKMLSSEDIIK